MRKKKGVRPFLLSAQTVIVPSGFDTQAIVFKQLIERLTAISPRIGGESALSVISLSVDPSVEGGDDAFVIDVEPQLIQVRARKEQGVLQALTALARSIGAGSAGSIAIPASTISGDPAFAYRGAHFDVCRHFYDVDQVKTFIDMMALHGLNRFHWHLTDDQGWRIEIKKYPRLTSIGSHRDSTTILRNSGRWNHTPVDGFYTQDQAREIISYAADRGIQVIPEIELPGHTRAALASYPQLGCTGGPYSVWTEWGVTDQVMCPGKDSTMQFFADVLEEIMDVFPSDIIHIGGDECPKTSWRDCPDCQARIRQLGIRPKGGYSAEDLLQGYVTHYAAEVCERRGRRAMGWDEILQADIPQSAIVMSWQGTDGAYEGVKRGNDVVLSPNSCMYFDFYQTKDTDLEPFAIGGYSPVEKVYAFDPWKIIEGKPASARDRLLGVQANLWTEYIPDFSHVQYMELPRMAALAEVQWLHPGQKDYADFLDRIPSMLAIYDRLGWNYARHIIDPAVTYTPDPESGSLSVALSALRDSEIRYTLDGSDPEPSSPLYVAPLSVTDPVRLKFASFREGRRGRVLEDSIHVSKASFTRATLNSTPAPGYAFGGAPALVDGITGTYNYRTGRWIGFNAEPFDLTLDLGQSREISSAGFNVAVFACDGVVDAQDAQLLVSDNGRDFRSVARWVNDPLDPADEFTVKSHDIVLPEPVTARYVRLKVNPVASLPDWHSLSGSRAFLFIDEVSLR